MNPKLLLLGTLLLSTVAAGAQSRFVTLVVAGMNSTNSLSIGTNQTAIVRSYIESSGFSSTFFSYMEISKLGYRSFLLDGSNLKPDAPAYRGAIMVAGPATFTLISNAAAGNDYPAFATIEIIPESFPPDKTIIVPSGTGANIVMEASTDLIHWTNAPPGVYTQTNDTSKNLFFRLRAERIQ